MDTKAGRKDAEIPANPGGQGGDYRFLDFTLDPRRQLLIHGADEIRLRPRTYDVLVHLVTHAGRVVGKSELMESVWKDVAVTDDSLVQSLMEIRRALGQAEGIVKTVRGRGYLFDTGVEMVTKDAVPTQGQDPHRDQTTDSSARDETSTNRPGLSSALVVAAVIAGIAAIVWWIGLSARRQASTPAPTGTIRSIAVLPLQNQSRDQEQEYFADGITDELITQLGKIGSLRVISRTSVMRLKGTRKALAEIAQDLNVDAVVEGSVARSAERVRVTAQVIQVNPEKLLWAERYDRALGDIVMLQGELAREITNAIRIALNADEQARLGMSGRSIATRTKRCSKDAITETRGRKRRRRRQWSTFARRSRKIRRTLLLSQAFRIRTYPLRFRRPCRKFFLHAKPFRKPGRRSTELSQSTIRSPKRMPLSVTSSFSTTAIGLTLKRSSSARSSSIRTTPARITGMRCASCGWGVRMKHWMK